MIFNYEIFSCFSDLTLTVAPEAAYRTCKFTRILAASNGCVTQQKISTPAVGFFLTSDKENRGEKVLFIMVPIYQLPGFRQPDIVYAMILDQIREVCGTCFLSLVQ